MNPSGDVTKWVAPIGQAWDLALWRRPQLRLHSSDGNHALESGAFLTALVLYASITGASPRKLPDLDNGVARRCRLSCAPLRPTRCRLCLPARTAPTTRRCWQRRRESLAPELAGDGAAPGGGCFRAAGGDSSRRAGDGAEQPPLRQPRAGPAQRPSRRRVAAAAPARGWAFQTPFFLPDCTPNSIGLVAQHQPRTFGGKTQRRRAADARTRAGDKRHLVLKLLGHVRLSCGTTRQKRGSGGTIGRRHPARLTRLMRDCGRHVGTYPPP